MPEDYGSQFMLQEYTRIIDAYHDLHRQKDALIRLYVTFVSLPVSVLAVFLALSRFFQANNQSGGPIQAGALLEAVQSVGIFLAIMLEFVGVAVLLVMLRIRGEQYLYVKTINGARSYFKEKFQIDAAYLVLPASTGEITFGQQELSGRAFWEAMIVALINSLLLGFLSYELSLYLNVDWRCALGISAAVFFVSVVAFILYIRRWLKGQLVFHRLTDVGGTPLPQAKPASR